MSQFKYTLPSGSEWLVNGPDGATQAQADKIFYEQVASGSLVGYTAGQTLSSAPTKITNFELSRLDRGTAGVDNAAILSVIQGLPIVAGVPNLNNTALQNPINQADVILAQGTDLQPQAVGPLPGSTVQKLLAQISNIVDQDSTVMTNDKGLGKYGFTAYQLEQAGYVKPGTSATYFADDPAAFVDVMNTPSVWTGKDGVVGSEELLTDENLQNYIQTVIMQQSYDSLVAAGTIIPPTTEPVSASQGTVYTTSGLQTASALTIIGSSSASLGAISNLAASGLLAGTTLSNLLSTPLTNLATLGSGALSNLSITSLSNLNFSSLLTSQVNGQLSSLIGNASKFGPELTSLWSKSGGLDSLNGLGTQLSNLNLSNLSLPNINLNEITTSLTNIIPGSLGNLTGSLDIFGKASDFAANFGNPLDKLSSLGNLGSIGNLGSLNLGSLSSLNLGSLSSLNLGGLSSLAGLGNLSSLANLGSLASLGSLGDLFGGGGDLVSGTQVAGGFNNTVNRKTVDAAFTRILGSSKIPSPIFEYPSLPSVAQRLDITQAQNFLKNLQLPSSSSVFGQTVTV